MTFVLWAALAIAGLVAAPVLAHLLRRGRAREVVFPGTALVPPLPSTARERSRLDDWPLLLVRGLLVVALAVLGATPLVRCDRLSVDRSSGGSVALALVLDDSLSMRAVLPDGGGSRWERAKQGAEELLASAREGDAVTLVFAGRPARIGLAPTTDLESARLALEQAVPSDRSTDLAGAVVLARSTLSSLPQNDRRIFVLSDLAGDALPDGTPQATTPLPLLATPVEDCALTTAERRGGRVTIRVACSSAGAARARKVELVVAQGPAPPTPKEGADEGRRLPTGQVLASADLAVRDGEQVLSVEVDAPGHSLDARLSGEDAIPHDDLAPVADEPGTPRIGVVADATQATARTGGPTVLEQALAALGDGTQPRPLPVLPDDLAALASLGALVLDDPAGFPPEARALLAAFAARGGVAVALLGPRCRTPELGSTLEPFAGGSARWEAARDLGIDPASLTWLGPEAGTLLAVARRGRVRLDGSELEGARVLGRWTDGVPFLIERRHLRGLFLTVGLPASLEESDFALRPAFLALLDHVGKLADVRSGARRTIAGVPWDFPDASSVAIEGPDGPVPVEVRDADPGCSDGSEPACAGAMLGAVPTIRGRYLVRIDDAPEARLVTIESTEILAKPGRPGPVSVASAGGGPAATPASREVALLLLALFAAELLLRLARRWAAGSGKGPGPSKASAPAPST